MTKERFELHSEICDRAIDMGYIDKTQKLSSMMDIERADDSFNLDLESFLKADTFEFVHDFFGIRNNVNRRTLNKGEKLTNEDWNFFVPRFATV